MTPFLKQPLTALGSRMSIDTPNIASQRVIPWGSPGEHRATVASGEGVSANRVLTRGAALRENRPTVASGPGEGWSLYRVRPVPSALWACARAISPAASLTLNYRHAYEAMRWLSEVLAFQTTALALRGA